MKKAHLYSVPQLQTKRGAGLGNEIIAYGKAIICAEELGVRLVHPPWALNARRYDKDFEQAKIASLLYLAARALPTYRIDHFSLEYDRYESYLETLREDVPAKLGLVGTILHSSGMSGGYLSILSARPYLSAALQSPAGLRSDLYKVTRRLDPERLTVAVHVRGGDFSAGTPTPGQFNVAIPSQWYVKIMQRLSIEFKGRIQFVIFGDADSTKDLRQHQDVVDLPRRKRPLLSDLHLMASADLLVCSISSFSLLATFLSDSPYIWFGPHAGALGGMRAIWAHEPSQRSIGATARHLEDARARPVDESLSRRSILLDSHEPLPLPTLAYLEHAISMKRKSLDLTYHGVSL